MQTICQVVSTYGSGCILEGMGGGGGGGQSRTVQSVGVSEEISN